MKYLALFILFILALSPGIVFSTYHTDTAYNFAVDYCWTFNIPPYCRIVDTTGAEMDCANFLSQILQHGGMGVCSNWVWGETLDPAADSEAEGCLPCGWYYTIQWAIPRMLDYLQASDYWDVYGPYDPDDIDGEDERPEAIRRMLIGAVVIIDFTDADYSHSMWVCESEGYDQQLDFDLTYHTSAKCPNENYTFSDWMWQNHTREYQVYFVKNVGSPMDLRGDTFQSISQRGFVR